MEYIQCYTEKNLRGGDVILHTFVLHLIIVCFLRQRFQHHNTSLPTRNLAVCEISLYLTRLTAVSFLINEDMVSNIKKKVFSMLVFIQFYNLRQDILNGLFAEKTFFREGGGGGREVGERKSLPPTPLPSPSLICVSSVTIAVPCIELEIFNKLSKYFSMFQYSLSCLSSEYEMKQKSLEIVSNLTHGVIHCCYAGFAMLEPLMKESGYNCQISSFIFSYAVPHIMLIFVFKGFWVIPFDFSLHVSTNNATGSCEKCQQKEGN